MGFEYKVVPAPVKGVKAKGVKGAEAQFAHALSELVNHYAADGWEYMGVETLPSLKRAGLTGKTTVVRNILVFRRALSASEEAPVGHPDQAARPVPQPPVAPQPPAPSAPAEARVRPPAPAEARAKSPVLPSAGAAQAVPQTQTKPRRVVRADSDATTDPRKLRTQ